MSVSPSSLSYLSIADRQMESLVPADDLFTQSLLEHVLFYRRALLIPDIFFFISTPLTQHVLSGGRSNSFLGGCVSNGLVVPALRAGGTFETSWAAIKEQGIQGLQPGNIPEQVMASLQRAQENGKQFRSLTWPEQQLGTLFENELRTQLQSSDSAPQVLKGAGVTQGQLNDLWQLTERWRNDCIEEAARLTQSSGGAGIRRGDIMNAVARAIGYPNNKVDDVKNLFDFATNMGRRGELEAFFLWVNLCYHKNQALAFDCALSFPRLDGISAVVAEGLLPLPTTQNDNIQIHEIQETIIVPDAKLLLAKDFDEILVIRKSEGAEYFEKLIRWESRPNDDLAQEVRVALRNYAERLRIIAARQGQSKGNEKIISHIKTDETNKEVIRIWMRAILNAGHSWLELAGISPIAKGIANTKSLTTLKTRSTTVTHQTRKPTEISAPISL